MGKTSARKSARNGGKSTGDQSKVSKKVKSGGGGSDTKMDNKSAPPTPTPTYDVVAAKAMLTRLMELEREQVRATRRINGNNVSENCGAPDSDGMPFAMNEIGVFSLFGALRLGRQVMQVNGEWMKAWNPDFELEGKDKSIMNRSLYFYGGILTSAYYTARIGLPERFVLSLGMYSDIPDANGQTPRANASPYAMPSILTLSAIKPIVARIIDDIAKPMRAMDMNFTEFVLIKALSIFKRASDTEASDAARDKLQPIVDVMEGALQHHFSTLALGADELQQRSATFHEIMKNIMEIGQMCRNTLAAKNVSTEMLDGAAQNVASGGSMSEFMPRLFSL